jgi:hypothetical protein
MSEQSFYTFRMVLWRMDTTTKGGSEYRWASESAASSVTHPCSMAHKVFHRRENETLELKFSDRT